jgi:hypothetical protein|tara:strand:- start:21 stop:257 length:237 start_codon:yes stop_codon:yes gene_type:complete
MPHAEIPAALKEFMDHRKHVVNKETKPEVKKKMGLTDHKSKAELEQGIQGIIEKRPKKKIVMEFFHERVKDLTATKMK